MDAAAEALQQLMSNPIVASRRVDGIWLFGSYASGGARPDSDVDLALLCEPPLRLMERTSLMDQIARAIGREVDLTDLRSAQPTLAWEIVTTGKLLYEGQEERVEHFVRFARYAAEDQQRRDRMILLAHVPSIGGRTR